jgi:hypothetical protein
MRLALQQQGRRGLLRHIEIALRAGHAMLALLKKVVGAVPVAEIVELPRLGGGTSASNHVLIDQNLDGAKVAGEISGIRMGLGHLQWCDLGVVLGCMRT